MTGILVSSNAPRYVALSTDITSGSTISDVSAIGARVYLTDTKVWKVVDENRILVDEVQGSTNKNYSSELALGNIAGKKAVNKFGIAKKGLQVNTTDIWDRADATPTQQIWVAPTIPRKHTIKSSHVEDKTSGSGINTVKVYYLPDWDTPEVVETITGDIYAGILMSASAVIIHRMKVVPQATSGSDVNMGTIIATAQGDSTITASITPRNGQTEMAIYGVPSTQTALMHSWGVQIDKAQGVAVSADFELRVNENPNVQLKAFLRKDDISLQSTGTSSIQKTFDPPNKFAGPCIIKVQGSATTADTDGEASFSLELIDN